MEAREAYDPSDIDDDEDMQEIVNVLPEPEKDDVEILEKLLL